MVLDALVAPFRVLVRQRQAITTFVQREIRARYSTSALGLGWAVIRPLGLLLLYTFVFSGVMNVRFGEGGHTAGGDTVNFAFYLFCGMVPWMAFSEGVARATTAIAEHAPLVKRMRFPSEILPVHLVFVALIVESLGLFVLLGALVVLGRPPGWSLLWLPLIVVPQVLLTAGLAWMIAALSVLLPDMRQAVSFGMIFWLYGTPVFYPASYVPERFEWILWINPVAYLVETYRGVVMEHQPPGLMPFAAFCALALAVFILGHWVFNRLKYEFVDVL